MTQSDGTSVPPPSLHLGPEDAAVFETFVVPRYLAFYGELLVGMLAETGDARVLHLHCRTGYPDRLLLDRLPNAHVYGRDPSEHAIELARAKAGAIMKEGTGIVFDYRASDDVDLPVPLPANSFSHAFTVHPLAEPAERRLILTELERVVAPLGQALYAMPLRGSFVEILDLLRECALKHELGDLGAAVDIAAQARPTDDLFKRELESVGFEHVEVDFRLRRMKFASGRRFIEDPVTRSIILPELRLALGMQPTPPEALVASEASGGARLKALDPFAYVRDAIDKYWSDGTFELTINTAVASGRKRG